MRHWFLLKRWGPPNNCASRSLKASSGTAVRIWLICSNRKLYHKKTIFLLPRHYTTIFFVIDCLTTFTAQIVHSHMYWGKIFLHQDRIQLLGTRGRRGFWEGPKFFKLCPTHFSRGAKTCQRGDFAPLNYGSGLHSLADQSVDRLEKMFSTKYHVKASWTVLLQFKGREQQKGRLNVNVCAAEENLEEELESNQYSIIISMQRRTLMCRLFVRNHRRTGRHFTGGEGAEKVCPENNNLP